MIFSRYFILFGIIGLFSKCKEKPEIDNPNFLFIITDDQSYLSLGTYGNNVCHTPCIDKIAEKGMAFTSAYIQDSWMSAVCVPSRTQIMTGRGLWTTVGLPQAKSPDYKSSLEANSSVQPDNPEYYSIPAIFNRSGYITFRTCKPSTSYDNADKLFMFNHEKWCVYADDDNGS
jgi:choline-sulfatase